jgi:hypothetical protein
MIVLVWIVASLLAAIGAMIAADKAKTRASALRRQVISGLSLVSLAISLVVASIVFAFGRDVDGRFAASPLKPWFDSLRSGKGPCCSDADGYAISDVDWETKDGRYRVRIPISNDPADKGNMIWLDVPDDAVITEPNRAGRTMVWPIWGYQGPSIRCFMPGSMT